MIKFKQSRLRQVASRRKPGYLEAVHKAAIKEKNGWLTFDQASPEYAALSDFELPKPARTPRVDVPPLKLAVETEAETTKFNAAVCRTCDSLVSLSEGDVFASCSARTCCGGKPASILTSLSHDACPKKLWTKARMAAKARGMIDRAVLINLDRRPERLRRVKAELAEGVWPFVELQVFRAVDGKKIPKPAGWRSGDGAWGCMQSHRHVMEQAIMDDVQTLLILEDDVTLVPDFETRIAAFLWNVPDDWDGLMIGGQHMAEPHVVMKNSQVVRCVNTQRTHCYAVRGRYLKALYQHFVSSSGHCDHRMGEFQHKFNIYAPRTFLAGQLGGASDIDGNSNHPTRFWASGTPHYYIAWYRGPKEMMQQLKGFGFHFGYNCHADGRDNGLIAIFTGGRTFVSKVQELRDWAALIQLEASAANGAIPSIWYPNPDNRVLMQALGSRIIELDAETPREVLAQWDSRCEQKDMLAFGT